MSETTATEALKAIEAIAGKLTAALRDKSDWENHSPADQILEYARGGLTQKVPFSQWLAALDEHHEMLRQTEEGFEGYGPGLLSEQTGADAWLYYYANGSSPEDALAEDRTYWDD